jgi:hypothetical protein
MALRTELQPEAFWERDIPLDSAMLAARVGATRAEVSQAVAALLSSQVILYSPGVGSSVRVAEDCWFPAPQVREIHWDMVRERLAQHRFPRMPAIAFLRELAVSVPGDEGWIHITLENAAGRTFFKRSALAQGALDLERIGCIERSHRPGQRGVYRIRSMEADSIAAANLADRTPPLVVAREVVPSPASGADAVGHHGATDTRLEHVPPVAPSRAVIEIAGVAFPIPSGTTLTPEMDTEGRLWYRIGAGTTRIGPIT